MDAVLQIGVLLMSLCGVAYAPPAGIAVPGAAVIPAPVIVMGTAPLARVPAAPASVVAARPAHVVPARPAHTAPPAPAPAALMPVTTRLAAESTQPADQWPGEDKFRHAGASWAAMVFTYAAARAVHDDSGTAIAVALPVTAALGVAKEFVDRRRGGPFSVGDLVADALGAGVAWLVLREVR